MAYEQYTKCEQAAGHLDMNQYVKAFLYTGPMLAFTVIIAAATPHPFCALIALEASAALFGIAYCDWWLYHRLICLGGDESAVGMVVSTDPPGEKTGFDAIDTDFSVNLLPPPNMPEDPQSKVEVSSPYGFLVKEQDATKNKGLPWTAHSSTDKHTGKTSWVLHAEFEGAGPYDMMIGCQVALGLSIAALIACLADALVGTIVAVILAILALLAALIGLIAGLNDQGTPEDVGLPSVETNDSGGTGADILGVFGTWVYDSGHNNEGDGWNEIHPVKKAAKLGTWKGTWPADTGTLIAQWTERVGEAGSPLTIADQQKPANQWEVHPLIDGCGSDDEQPPPEPPH